MAKPTEIPTWATGATGLSRTTAPNAQKLQDGWAPAEKPPAQYFNWLLNRLGQWATYLNGLTGEALTWTVKQVFSAGLSSAATPTASSTDVARMVEVTAETNARIAADALKANDNAVVKLTGDQTVAGIKTFSSSPLVPDVPSGGTAAVNRNYIDTLPATLDTPTPGTGVSIVSLSVARRGRLVTMSGQVTFGTTAFATGAVFLTLSSGFWPLASTFAVCTFVKGAAGGSHTGIAAVFINTTGQVSISYSARLFSAFDGAVLLPTQSADRFYLSCSFYAA